MKDIFSAEYFSETYDEKTAGRLILDRGIIVACYTLPKYPKRTMVLTEGGLKFCVKGIPSNVMGTEVKLLEEA